MTLISEKRSFRYQVIAISLSLLIHGAFMLLLRPLFQGLPGKVSTITIDVSVLDNLRNTHTGGQAAAGSMERQDKIQPQKKVQEQLPETPVKPSRKPSLKALTERSIEPLAHRKVPMVPFSSPDPARHWTAEISGSHSEKEDPAPESGQGATDGSAEDEMHAGDNAVSNTNSRFTQSGMRGAAGSGEPGLEAHYSLIRMRLQNALVYPGIAREKGWSGEVIVSFMLLPDGNVEEIRVKKSSGIAVLDQSAIQTIKKASPLPILPMTARIVIPIVFQLN